MCTVLLRFQPDATWPLLLAAVRDEFTERPWDRPDAFWPDRAPGVVAGRDRLAGGTWLAVRREQPAVAALLNGVRLPEAVRPTRGDLPLAALTGSIPDLTAYDGCHLLLGTPDQVRVWSWDGERVVETELTPGDHIIVNAGVDTVDDPLVPHFAPILGALPDPPLSSSDTESAWGSWVTLLRGDGLATDDPRALLVRHEFGGHVYGSTSASLVAISRDAARFDFTATPLTPNWHPVLSAQRY